MRRLQMRKPAWVIAMNIGKLCTQTVIFVDRAESARQAAGLMRQYHVGDLIVIDASNPVRVPVGIVTDRDITTKVTALGVDPESITAGDIMSKNLVTAREADDEVDTARRMRNASIRRIPVVGEDGALVGILARDDLFDHIHEELAHLSEIPSRQRFREAALTG